MSQFKKIQVSIPDNLLKEIDYIVSEEKINRSEFVRDAMKLYVGEKRRSKVRNDMEQGYREMAEINLKFAEMCYEADNVQHFQYEKRLREYE